jgi:hypothetical protein
VSDELRSLLERDYDEMISSDMFVEEPPAFERITARLADLEARINAHLEATPVNPYRLDDPPSPAQDAASTCSGGRPGRRSLLGVCSLVISGPSPTSYARC